ncbi:hypothetical protein FHX80_112638 [Streptomyces brevispora]|uniref:Uncharacterized protein n=1 Tax=Streptomyces brevispora TaxID=887462 RepID=A0A561UXV9_9ACTN|nr:hypothetical protein FHX80_112638 [Streptomyces brevispora]
MTRIGIGIRTDARLRSEEEAFDEVRGRYHCALRDGNGKAVVVVDAYLDGTTCWRPCTGTPAPPGSCPAC